MKKIVSVVSIAMLLLAGCNMFSSNIYELKYEVQDFEYTNQHGEPVSLDDLAGKVWIASFIFTNCEDVCPPITANLARLQRHMQEAGVEAQLVSFSVDPEVDTPEKLVEFAEQFHVDFSNWSFLTGYSQEEIEEFSRQSFKALVDKPQNSHLVTHTIKIYLVDQEGIVVKDYNGLSNTPYEEIIDDIKTLL